MSRPVAVIPVAGIGSRLRPHTHTVPKALINVAGRAMVAHILDELISLGVEEYVLVVGYKGDRVREYIERKYPRLKVTFVDQPQRKGLGHAIYLTKEAVAGREAIIVLGDTLFRVNFSEVLGKTVSQIGVKNVDDPRRFGIVEMDGERVKRFVEKPEHPRSNLAIVGIYYIVDTKPMYAALEDLIRKDQATRGEYQLTDALQAMLEQGIPMQTFPVDGWYDCGKKETLLETNRSLLNLNAKTPEIEGSVIIPPVAVDPTAVVRECIIGPYATIAAGVHIEASIVRNSIVNDGAKVKAMLLDESLVGEDALVEGSFCRLNVGDSSELLLS